MSLFEIETDVPEPLLAPKSRARRAARGTKQTSSAAGMIEALKFVLQRGEVTKEKFCRVQSGGIFTASKVLEIWHPIEETLEVTVHTAEFLKALQQAKSDLAITQLEHSLVVTSGDSRVACATMPGWLPTVTGPDVPCLAADGRLIEALAAVSALLKANGEPLHTAALIQSGSAAATDGEGLLEYWHGLTIPRRFLVPLIAIKPVCKVQAKLVSLGFTESTLTFHFDNGAWLKTRLFEDKFPDYASVFELQNPFFSEMPEQFKTMVKTVAGFGDGATVTVAHENFIFFETQNPLSTFRFNGIQTAMQFEAAKLKPMLEAFKSVWFDETRQMVFAENGNLRGVAIAFEPQSEIVACNSIDDYSAEEIPF